MPAARRATSRFIVLAGLLAWALPVQAQIGPPQPRARPLDFSLGVGLHNVDSTWTPYDYDISRNRVYFEGSFAFTDSIEIFGRVGGSDFVINEVATYEPDEDHDVASESYPMFFSGGVRGTLWASDGWSLGGSCEVGMYSGIEKNIRWDYNVYQTLLIDPPIEINLGLSFGCELGGTVLYAGPLLHFGYTSVDIHTHKFGRNWEVEDEVNALTIRDKAGIGAFAGWQVPLGENGWQLQLEGAVLKGGFGIGVGIFRTL